MPDQALHITETGRSLKEKSRMKRLASILAVMAMLWGGLVMAEYAEEAWYAEALKESRVSLGNNLRIKNVIARAQAGEQITVATVGGSITEGAAASSYEECWASQFARLFGETYGTDGGTNVALVNCGVGGTPSPFGWMRYGRDILARVPETDPDGYPDVVVIEYAVNDWAEPTGGRCYESMVKEILSQPNEPAVLLLFTVRNDGWNLQDGMQKIGERYGLLMVSARDGLYPHLDKDYPKMKFYSDEYHPKSSGHRMMADALMQAVKDAAAAETAETDVDLSVTPVYGTDFTGLKTIYGDSIPEGITVERGSFDKSDKTTYSNKPVGQVCGKNFCHGTTSGTEPMKITGVFSKCLISWKAAAENTYGTAEVRVDGKLKTRLTGGPGKWGQSEVVLVLDEREAAEHTIEISVVGEGKRFTITAISVR